MPIFKTKYKYLLPILFLLIIIVLIYMYTTRKHSENGQIASYNFTKSVYTYTSENFYYECKIIVNGMDDKAKEESNISNESMSLNYTFDMV